MKNKNLLEKELKKIDELSRDFVRYNLFNWYKINWATIRI